MKAEYDVMLPVMREEPFDDERYIFEPKLDGHRLLLEKTKDGRVRLLTRYGDDITRQYPELHAAPVHCSCVVLDGEVAYVNPATGIFEFEPLIDRFRMKKTPKIREGMRLLPVKYFAFDVLSVDGEDVRSFPLSERKAILHRVLGEGECFEKVAYAEGGGIELFDYAKESKLEGIVAKRKSSVYAGGRSDDWMKVINYTYLDVQLAGYRKNQFGWLAHFNGRPVGVIELSVPAEHRQAFYRIAQRIVTGEDRDFVYVHPSLTAKIRFRSRSRNGLPRSPEFVSFVL